MATNQKKMARYKIDNANDLREVLLGFARSALQVILIEDFDCLDLYEETITDGSKVMNFQFTNFTAAERKRERE